MSNSRLCIASTESLLKAGDTQNPARNSVAVSWAVLTCGLFAFNMIEVRNFLMVEVNITLNCVSENM